MIAPVLFTQVFALAIGPFQHRHVPGAPFLLAALLLVSALAVGLQATSARPRIGVARAFQARGESRP